VLFLTYDEGGGFFDHVPLAILETVPSALPDAGEAVGPGFRVPLFVVSPWARPGSIYKPVTDHTSILQFVERTFSTRQNPVLLPTIDARRRDLYSLVHAFDFTQTLNTPSLPTAKQLIGKAKLDILTLNADRTVADCSTSWPGWLLPLLGA
jgi:phospholipase C